MNIKQMEFDYKKYLIFTKKDEIKAEKNIIKDYKMNLAELVLANAKQEEINKYVRFIEKHEQDIKAKELEIANLIVELDKLEKEINNYLI